MSLIDEIRTAQRDAGEAAVIRNLERLGLGSVGHYATAEETASIMRKATPNELWLEEQLHRINPHLGDTGSGDGMREMELLVFQLKDTKTQLQGEAKVMRTLLEESLNVLTTLEPEDDNDHARLESLKRMIVAVVEMQLVRL